MIPWFYLLLLAILAFFIALPFIPAIIEYWRRRDKGPRTIPEITIAGEKAEATPREGAAIESFPFIERSRIKSRVKTVGGIMRVAGDLSIPDGTEINTSLVVHGHLKTGKGVIIKGSCKATGGIELGAESLVEGHLISGKDAILDPSTRVNGVVDAVGDVVCRENSYIGSVSADKSVKLDPNAKIGRRISVGEAVISTQPPQPQKPEAISKLTQPAATSEELLELDKRFFEGKIGVEEYLKSRREVVEKESKKNQNISRATKGKKKKG